MVEPGAKHYFPVFLDMTGRLAVIVGTGPQAEKRVRQFARYGANVVVIGPDPGAALVEAQADGAVDLVTRPYVSGDLTGAFVVICVTDDPEVRQAVRAEAETQGCMLNVTSAPEMSNFLVPGVFRKESLEVAVSTGGSAPPVAKAFRRWLGQEVGKEWAAWIALITDVRNAAEQLEDEAHRKRAIDAVSDAGIRDRLAAGESLAASDIIAATEVEESEQ